MPVTLNAPVEPVVLQKAKVVNFTVENNVEHWIVVYVSFGVVLDNGAFVEWVDPATGVKVSPLRVKIEDGMHPLAEGRALCKCSECGHWGCLEAGAGLPCPECGGEMVPYDGFTRLATWGHGAGNLKDTTSNVLYAFLTGEQVPDPVTGEVKPLLDAAQE